MRPCRTRRFLVVAAGAASMVLLVLSLFADQGGDANLQVLFHQVWLFGVHNSSEANDIACYYEEEANRLEELAPGRVARDTSIFFHETSCHAPGTPFLTSRQACAVESAAKMNPDSEVYLLYPSPIATENSSRTNPLVHQLQTYKNIRIRHVSMEKYFQDTPLEAWYKTGYLQTSRFPRSHASDLLRYVTLWKFGGMYLDLDVVVVKTLKGLTNLAGAESNLDVAAGVLSFSSNGSGHEIATECLMDLKRNFRGYDWGYNGPGVITRVLKKTCEVDKVEDMTPERCKGFRVYPPKWFYPVPWRSWHHYFDSNNSAATMARLESSYVIHVWNKFSITANITVGSNQPYGLIASKYCPRTYANSGTVF